MIGTEQAKVESAVLLANASFYRAFSEGDAKAMGELWAKRAPVACLHPGAELISGRAAVMSGWRQILRGEQSFELRCDSPTVRVFGELALVQCYEATDDQSAHLAATNAFVLEDGAWRMVHHQAGPLSRPIPKPEARGLVN
ncbi:MAG TPA: nuclear transport factor 2 family protein [Polyangiaceae bacterium]|nr:nuclear transport factor 2 family protein [Polyangiaceae bacterium]